MLQRMEQQSKLISLLEQLCFPFLGPQACGSFHEGQGSTMYVYIVCSVQNIGCVISAAPPNYRIAHPQVPSNSDHETLNRGTQGVLPVVAQNSDRH